MPQIDFLGYPLSTLLLYFCFYAFAGWLMETAYCSILERRFVSRGFLRGPICPIYGVGVLLMILFFKPLAGNILVFYLVSTVTMSAWEYFVGWFLEVTTHMKYWDYSMYRFNLKGRICLWVCLVWGLLSYVCIFWIHPPVERAVAALPPLVRDILAIALAAVILADAVVTIRDLALMTKVMNALQQAGSGLSSRFQDAREAVASALPEGLSESGAKLREKYNDLVAAAERRTRRFRHTYAQFDAPKLDAHFRQAIAEKARQVVEERQAKQQAKKQARQARRASRS